MPDSSNTEVWTLVFSVFSLIISAVSLVLPTPSGKTKFLADPCWWLWRYVPYFWCMWYTLFAVSTVLSYELGIFHREDDSLDDAEMYISLITVFVAVLLMIWPAAAYSTVFSTIITAMVSKWLTLENIVHTRITIIVLVVILWAAAFALSECAAKVFARIQHSMSLAACFVLSAMYLHSSTDIWIGESTQDAALVFGCIAGVTVVRLVYLYAYAKCHTRHGYHTAAVAENNTGEDSGSGKGKATEAF